MKRPAFYLLAAIIAGQMAIATGVLAACFATKQRGCTGEKTSELLTLIVTQSFALYAAEK